MRFHVSAGTSGKTRRPGALSPGTSATNTAYRPIVQARRLVGDHALISPLGRCLQPKLRVGPADDRYEREADGVADQVMRVTAPIVQRVCTDCKEEELRRASAADAPGTVRDVLSGSGGRPLDPSVRGLMESRLGYGFSNVRVHTGGRAAESARSISAVAYTVGRDIVFDEAAYRPETDAGRWLIAHELTHVIQQGHAARVPSAGGGVVPMVGEPPVSRDGRGPGDELDGRIQRLAVRQQSFHQGPCGERRVRWIFSLTNPAPEDGYIVQQVDNFKFDRGCPPKAGPPAPERPFWEAWFVQSGARNEHLHATFGFTDQHARPASAGTSGSQITAGTVKFFKLSVTGDLGRDSVAPAGGANPDWGPGNAPPSGSLPSTLTQPAWWGRSHEGPAARQVNADWNCCDARPANQSSTVTATP